MIVTLHTLLIAITAAILPAVADEDYADQDRDTFNLEWRTVDGGGALHSMGGDFALSGTIGQHDASTPLTGGHFELTGGFWPSLAELYTIGDCDGDDDVDAQDYADFPPCLYGPEIATAQECRCADLDNDGDVDLQDFALFQEAYITN